MKKQYLGDAFDWWKGGILRLVSETFPGLDVQVVPCLTDENDWRDPDWDLYAKLLQVNKSQIRIDTSIQSDGAITFQGQDLGNDLFLDPDTGVKTGGVREKYKHISPSHIATLFSKNKNRLLIIYQHGHRGKIEERICDVVRCIQDLNEGIDSCAVVAGGAALLFISHDKNRVLKIRDNLSKIFGSVSRNRVFSEF